MDGRTTAAAAPRRGWSAASSSCPSFCSRRCFARCPSCWSSAPTRTGSAPCIASTVREILALVDAARPGTQMMLGRLMELLFVEVLRRHASRLPAGSKGWFAALNDPVVGARARCSCTRTRRDAGRRMISRAKPGPRARCWPNASRRCSASPPIEYVTSWRIQLAADRLRNGRDGIASIAAEVGYEFGSGVQPRIQAGDRHHARTMARRSRRRPGADACATGRSRRARHRRRGARRQ